jgi:pentapeptide MXKDX repeat protein
MRNSLKIAALVAALAAGLAAAPVLYAQDTLPRSQSGPGMMGHGGMTGEGGMMGMMRQMSRMMDHCSSMMGGGSRPNEQWRKDTPATPEKKG